jgi:2-polyprenyl-3-methyl-5-hydroxy-6-metoxy-1,4-benzoquinol methylase
MSRKQYIRANRQLWDELTALHLGPSAYYDVDAFKAGKLSLRPLERSEVGDVTGKSLLHLQCHCGLDTLSWARLGATVTGVDFSPRSIQAARSLAKELGIAARFVCSDLYDLAQTLPERYDVVYTSYGVLLWLPDLPRWAETIARHLHPGGVFYIIEGHPFSMILRGDKGGGSLAVVKSYFPNVSPTEGNNMRDYASPHAHLRSTGYSWRHSLGEILNALLGAGLRIEYLHEFPFADANHFPELEPEQDAEGWWWLPGQPLVPMLFSVKAISDV